MVLAGEPAAPARPLLALRARKNDQDSVLALASCRAARSAVVPGHFPIRLLEPRFFQPPGTDQRLARLEGNDEVNDCITLVVPLQVLPARHRVGSRVRVVDRQLLNAPGTHVPVGLEEFAVIREVL